MNNERDPELEKLYRANSREEPPPALDAAILAAAHRAVASAPRKAGEATRPQRWWMPLAAAAAIGVIQQMPKESAIDATSVAPAAQAPPAPEQAAPATSAEYPAPVDTELLTKKQKEADALKSPPPPAPAAPAAKPPAATPATPPPPPARENKLGAEPAPVPFPAAPALRKSEAASSEGKRDMPAEPPMADARKDAFREERQNAAPALAGAPPTAPPASAPVARMRAQSEMAAGAVAQSKNDDEEMRTLARDPDSWIARLRKLRDEGNTAQALRELKEFRALVPDAERRLPPDLRSLQP